MGESTGVRVQEVRNEGGLDNVNYRVDPVYEGG